MTPQQYLDLCPIYTDEDRSMPRPQWMLTKAYVRLSSSGTIQLERFRNRESGARGGFTNHEDDRWLIDELAANGLLRVEYAPFTINLFPSEDGVDWLAVMDDMDDPNKPDPHYSTNPLYGAL